jgi:very-short-patch-repair endonuclease
MNLQEWLLKNKTSFGSDYEALFAKNVLPLVPELSFDSISVQFPFNDIDRKQRYCDFVIMEEGDIRIAIEIDGYDKRGIGMSHQDFVDWQRRQAALVSQGWFVLRFANRDVRDHPNRCAEHISLLLKRERSRAKNKELSPDDKKKLEQLTTAQQTEISNLHKETSIMKYTIMSFTAIIGFLVLAFVFQGGNYFSPSVQSNQVMAATSVMLGSTCESPLDWRYASENIGKTAAIKGPIVRVSYKEAVKGAPTWIEVGATYPNTDRLVLIVWGHNRDKFTELLPHQLEGKNVCAIGLIEQYKGIPQVELKLSSQIQLVK